MAWTAANSTAVFVKYGGNRTRDRNATVAVIIYIDNDDIDSMTFKSLDRIARCKRFRTSEIEALTCDLLSVKLENSSERNHVLVPVNTADRVAAAFDTSYFPEKAIIWFELPPSAVAGRKATAIAAHATSLKKKILLDNSSAAVVKKNVVKKSNLGAVTSMNIDKINPLPIDFSASSSSSTNNNNSNTSNTTTGSLQLPIALSSRSTDDTQEQSATNVTVTGGGGGVRTDPRISGPRASVTFQIPKKSTTETSPAKTQFANNKNSDPSFANVLESIGIGKVLISRISHTPLPLPANLPHAPKILKKVEKLSTIGNVSSSTVHTHSVQSGNKSSSSIVTKSIENDAIKSVRSNDSNDDNINNENDDENCQNKNDDDNGENSNIENTIILEKSSVETSYDDNALEITEMTLENTDSNRVSKQEKENSDSSDMEVEMDLDLGYDSGDNCNDEIENTQLCSMSNDYDDDNDNDEIDLIDFEANYTVTSRLWGNRNGQNFPVENGICNSQVTDVKDVLNLIDKSIVQKDNEKNNDVTDEKSKIHDTGASVIRFRKSPLNSAASPVEPVGEKRAGIPRCGSKYQADIEPFEASSSLLQPLDNITVEQIKNKECLWSNDTFHGTFVERFLIDLKTEQLECSEKGDYLWDFSGFLEKSSRANSVDLGPLNSRNSSSPSTLPVPPLSSSSSSSSSSSFSSSISPSLPVTTSFSPTGVLKSRHSMQRGVNSNETSRVKFVCVINNFRANQISNLEQDKDYDINEKDILVFDGHKEYSLYFNQCEHVTGLSYHFISEERALQILFNCKGDTTQALKFCRQESAKSRILTPDDLTLYRKSKQPFIMHPYNSFPSVSHKPLNTATAATAAAGAGTGTGASIAETSATPSTAGAISLPVPIPSSDPVPPALSSCDNAKSEAEESALNAESNDIMDINNQEDGDEKEKVKILLKKNDDFAYPATEVTSMTLNNITPETPDVIESHPVTSIVISSLTDTVNSSGLTTNILDSDPRSSEILESDPTSHEMILEHVNPLCTTDLLQTDSYDIYDAEEIDSYFDCLTDSKSWDESDICDILNDTEVHEVVEDLIAKVVEIASNQEKLNTCTHGDSEVKEIMKVVKILDTKNKSCALIRSGSRNVEIENKDQYGNCGNDNSNNNEVTNDNNEHCEGGGGPDGDSDESALSRYEHDVSAGMDDVAHKDSYIWQTARRWTAATVKVLLGALIDIRTLPRVRRNMNNKLAASPSAAAECDSITTGDCILLYYLFGESYVLSHTDSSTIKDICRDISWASTLYSVFKKSNQVTIGKNKKIPGSDSAKGLPLGRPVKVPSNLHIPKRNVGFSEGDDGENIQIKRSTAAFQRLQRQHDREQPSTSVTRIPENHKTLPSGSGLNELSSDDFSVFNLKYDCSKASHYFTGLSLEGNKGSYKEVLEYSGRSVDPNLMKKGDFLLSIDGNDVKNMSMCGLSAFLKKTIERKSANMRNLLQKSKRISMKKRFVSMTFRRMTLDIAKTRAIELITKPTQKAARVDNINVFEKTVRTERLSSSPPVHAQEPFPEKEPTQVRQSRSRLASDSQDDTIDVSNSKSPEIPEVKRQRVSPCESSVDDDIVSSDNDSVEKTGFDQQVRLIKRMSVGSKIFVNTHPAEVLKIDINALSIQVKWESGMKSWIEIDHEKMSLQDDILQTSRRR